MAVKGRKYEEIVEAIRHSTRDEVILEEMIRFGFWPAEGEIPQDPADEIRLRGELQRELSETRSHNRRLQDEETLKVEARKRRLEESRRKQQENKERRERERQERAESWRLKKEKDIVYLGDKVSRSLNYTECNEERLKSYELPRLGTAEEIATAMGLSIGQLRFLAFNRRISETTHYIRFQIPKKTGGHRVISAPMPRLKEAQQWILENILEKVEMHTAAHGFRASRSIVTNARPHVGAGAIVNIDLKDFFPSVAYKRVKGLFRSLGYSDAAATIFGLICTEAEVEQVELDGKIYYVATSDRHLPQGAPSSPAITNLLCRRLDRRLSRMAEEMRFTYTRYADDLTFSASGDDLKNICNVLRRAESIVAHEGFEVHPGKTRVLRRSRQQEVTGVVVNTKPNVSRKELKKFRAAIFQIEKDGPVGKRWGKSEDVLASMLGYANYVYMVNPEKGAEFQASVRALIDKYGWQPRRVERQLETPSVDVINSTSTHNDSKESPAKDSADDNKPSKKWWKLF
jgi:retron-type reverse transcriptase